MIIGINGKIGSGKDTVGSIIQYLTLCKKHNITDLPYDEFVNSAGWLPHWQIKKFAGKLKTIGSILTGIPVEKFEDQEFKQKHMGLQWKMTYREFLQKLGTEAMRDGLHENTWVNALFADYNATGYNYTVCENKVIQGEWEYPNWIITDMRFPNEMEAVEEREGITIRVVRYPKTVEVSRGPQDIETIPFDPTNQKHMDLWKGESSRLHPSETSLDSAEFDYTIVNDSTIEDLVKKVREILITEKII